ncbi:hypothetical protein FEE95_02045 [Maribacter algarum]|uniref:Uncharacterized protein n=1 Tax=Maribacter algarum (ex Zhang et al. 2020) TaxID=2578118 RepID=A0A5S3PVK4_9FLAO|nr:hypothetical protein [Maribacter algarum]TMM58232.1 hypothetical protein FEE95_02045 [Maribacter algarum]
MKIQSSHVALLLCIFIFVNCNSDNTVLVLLDEEQVDTDNTPEDTNTEPDENTDSSENTLELVANDLSAHPMQGIDKPAYLETITDPSFGTTIRRISDAGDGNIIKPMYSTIQAWNSDESLMILYEQGVGHQLLNGMDYSFIRYLDDVNPDDLEQIFWDFNDPEIFFYIDRTTAELVKYNTTTQNKEALTNLKSLTNCADNIGSGNDVQMMSWNSDVIGFRCDNTGAYAYRISTGELITFNIDDVQYTAPMPGASGNQYYHGKAVYDMDGNQAALLNESSVEHSCLGKLIGGNDAHFAVAFAEGPEGGCIGNIIAHDLTTGECFPVISEEQGYDYPKSGTHISAVAHKSPGWIAASMVGNDEDGQSLLDQELIIARVEKGNVEVYRIGHHRADENEFDYWGEPHAVISPTGTRVLFGSDWSGSQDGKSVDAYVVELPNFIK